MKKLKKELIKILNAGVTEDYVNTVLRLNPVSWDIHREMEALLTMLQSLEKGGLIKIIISGDTK